MEPEQPTLSAQQEAARMLNMGLRHVNGVWQLRPELAAMYVQAGYDPDAALRNLLHAVGLHDDADIIEGEWSDTTPPPLLGRG